MSPSDPLRGLRVCLVTPGHLSTNPRLVKEADALVAQGAQVRVVHGRFLDWAESADAVFAGRTWRRHAVPFGPRAGRTTWLRQGIAQRAARIAGAFGRDADAARGFHPVTDDLARAAAGEAADVYIGHNLAGGIAAARAAARHGVLLGFDAEDDHVGELADAPRHAAERSRRTTILRRLLQACAHLTAASPGIAGVLAREFGVRPVTVLNVFPLAEAASLPTPGGSGSSLYWMSQTVGPGRGLEAVVDVLADLDRTTHLELRGKPAPGYPGRLRERLAARGGDPGRIVVEPPVPPDQVTAGFHRHALALSTEIDDCRNHTLCLGNKIFHALLAGTPVLLSATPAQRELARDLGSAALCHDLADTQGLALRLVAWLADPQARAAAARAAWEIARRRYCWDLEQQVFLDALRAALLRARERRA